MGTGRSRGGPAGERLRAPGRRQGAGSAGRGCPLPAGAGVLCAPVRALPGRCLGEAAAPPAPGARMDAAVPGSGPGLLLLALGLAVFSCVDASWNVTADYGVKRPLCSSPEDCTDNITQLQWGGHFSKCPEKYKHYCVKGRCRYVMAEETPACVCEKGYTGARCERVDIFYLRGDQSQIVVVCLVAAMVALIGLVICICTCSRHCRKRRRRRRKEEEMETLEKGLPAKPEDVLETDIA